MKIHFTQKEYARLLEMSYIATWIAGANDEDSPAARRYADLEQKLYSLAAHLGCGDYVEGDGANGEPLFPSQKLEEDSHARKAIDAFEDDSFWSELVTRLAERDCRRELMKNPLPGDAGEEAHREHLIRRIEELGERYWAEFEKNGLDNVITLFDTNRLS
jgi:hypothetical protein